MPAQKRRSPGDGSIRILKNGTVEFTATLEDKDGFPIRKRFYAPTEKEAKRKCRDWIANAGQDETDETLGAAH